MKVLCSPGRKSVFGVPAPFISPAPASSHSCYRVWFGGHFLREALQVPIGLEALGNCLFKFHVQGLRSLPGPALPYLRDTVKMKTLGSCLKINNVKK